MDLLTLARLVTPSSRGEPMATTNPTITGAWTLIVAAGDEFFLSFPLSSQIIHVATGATDSEGEPEPPAAGLTGHTLAPGRDGMNRALIGPGPVYARCVDPTASVPVALTAWTPA